MTRADAVAIWKDVKANHQRLDDCPGPHDFSIEFEKAGALVRRYQCTRCQGVIDVVDRVWYQRGLDDGRRAGGAS